MFDKYNMVDINNINDNDNNQSVISPCLWTASHHQSLKQTATQNIALAFDGTANNISDDIISLIESLKNNIIRREHGAASPSTSSIQQRISESSERYLEIGSS